MKKFSKLFRVVFSPLLIAVLTVALQGGKSILDGIYIIFPLIYVFQAVFCSYSMLYFVIGALLSSIAFLVPINILYNMGNCIDLALIYVSLAVIVYAAKILIKSKKEKKNKKAEN